MINLLKIYILLLYYIREIIIAYDVDLSCLWKSSVWKVKNAKKFVIRWTEMRDESDGTIDVVAKSFFHCKRSGKILLSRYNWRDQAPPLESRDSPKNRLIDRTGLRSRGEIETKKFEVIALPPPLRPPSIRFLGFEFQFETFNLQVLRIGFFLWYATTMHRRCTPWPRDARPRTSPTFYTTHSPSFLLPKNTQRVQLFEFLLLERKIRSLRDAFVLASSFSSILPSN